MILKNRPGIHEILGRKSDTILYRIYKGRQIGKLYIKQTNCFLQKKLLNNWETLPTSFVTSSSTGLGKDDFLGFIATVNEDVADNFK